MRRQVSANAIDFVCLALSARSVRSLQRLTRLTMRWAIVFFLAYALGTLTAFAQLQKIGIIDFYGLRAVKKERLQENLGVKAGDVMPVDFPPNIPEEDLRKAFNIPQSDPLPPNLREVEQRILNTVGVTKARAMSVCCESDGTATLFVGISEGSNDTFQYRPEPKGTSVLSADILSLYDRHIEILATTVKPGNADEDDSEGHALFKGEQFEKIQAEIKLAANTHSQILVEALEQSRSVKERAAAAWILGYTNDKKFAADKLLAAARDSSELVRNNATRALGAIITLANRRPELEIKIPADLFVGMLHSLIWSDRNKAEMVLVKLTESHRPDILDQLRKQAFTELTEMARWQDSHSLMSLMLLGRIAGIQDAETKELWKTGKRERVIERARLQTK